MLNVNSGLVYSIAFSYFMNEYESNKNQSKSIIYKMTSWVLV